MWWMCTYFWFSLSPRPVLPFNVCHYYYYYWVAVYHPLIVSDPIVRCVFIFCFFFPFTTIGPDFWLTAGRSSIRQQAAANYFRTSTKIHLHYFVVNCFNIKIIITGESHRPPNHFHRYNIQYTNNNHVFARGGNEAETRSQTDSDSEDRYSKLCKFDSILGFGPVIILYHGSSSAKSCSLLCVLGNNSFWIWRRSHPGFGIIIYRFGISRSRPKALPARL